MHSFGKRIEKTDDGSKEFQRICLEKGKNINEKSGKGIDIETLYYAYKTDIDGKCSQKESLYYVIEYLKDQSKFVDPWQSDPNKYQVNWRKFYALYRLAQKLEGQLVLVNYSDGKFIDGTKVPEEYSNKVKLMYVNDINLEEISKMKSMDYNTLKDKKTPYINYSQSRNLTIDTYANWLIALNSNAILPDL